MCVCFSCILQQVRPVSTSVVIVQDTDVTITGVYVNSSLGSSQEAYCKMQYRVQSSVTEERVLRPNAGPDQPPKSYTPLTALSSMRPPGAQQEGNPFAFIFIFNLVLFVLLFFEISKSRDLYYILNNII